MASHVLGYNNKRMCIKCSNSVTTTPNYSTMPYMEADFSQHPQTYCSEVAVQNKVLLPTPVIPFNDTTDLKQLQYT